MPLYEHVFISRQDLSNAQAEGLIEHFSTVLKDNGGKVIDSEYWGVKTMAYKINKNRKGHYVLLNINAPAAAVIELERQLKINEDVLRYITVRVEAFEQSNSSRKREREGGRREEGENAAEGAEA